jgi:hypothetical protein
MYLCKNPLSLSRIITDIPVIRKIWIVVLFFLTYISHLSSQRLDIKASPFVLSMMERFSEYGKKNETVRAWRVQIITTDDRREMEAARSKFASLYPTVSMDWKHEVPYYQVRVGAFENKIKMMPFLLEVRKQFPSATPVQDNISKRTLVNSN